MESNNQNQRDKTELIKELINKERELSNAKNKQKQVEKEIKKIESSNTWKYFQPISKGKGTNKDFQINDLQQKLIEKQAELHKLEEQVQKLTLDDRMLTSVSMREAVKKAETDGRITNFLEEAVQHKINHTDNYVKAISYAARIFMNDKKEYRDIIYSSALKGLDAKEVPEFIVRSGLEEEPLSLHKVSSFRSSLTMRMREKQLTGLLPEWKLDDKKQAYQFMENLNVPVPWSSRESYPYQEIPMKDGIVIKPVDGAGSRGVYLVHSTGDIFDVKRSNKLHSWEALIQSMDLDLKTGWVTEDKWYIEELLLENKEKKQPARDIKFYCFYGKVGLILEIVRYPELKYCWWDESGERIRTGKYEDDLFKGNFVTEKNLRLVRKISHEIPAPFVRIDFLQTENGLVFGEFTPKPGNYDEFNEEVDQMLGDYFIEAQGRLTNDLLQGKKFPYFWE